MGLKGGRKGKSGTWSTDVNELERLSRDGVPIARLVLEWRQLSKLKSHLYRRAPAADQQGDRPGPHQLFAVGRADRPAFLDRSQSAEHPDPDRDRPPDPRRLRRRAGPCHARRRLQPDRASPRRPHGRRAAAQGGLRGRRGHPQPDRSGAVRRGQSRHPRQRQDDQLRDPLRNLALGPGRPALDHRRRGAGDDRPLFRALPRNPQLYRRHAGATSARPASPPPCSAARPTSR